MPAAQNKKTGEKAVKQKGNETNPYLLLTLVLLFALFIVLLILKSNNERVEQKLAKVQQAPAEQNELSGDHPSMDKMVKIQAIKDSLKNAPNDYHLLVELANNYFDINRFDLAIANYQKALKQNHKEDVEVVIDLGVAYFNFGKLDSALYFMNKALVIAPNHPLALLNKGVIQFNLGKIKESIQTWKKLIKLYPNSSEATNAKEFVKQAEIHLNKS